MVAATELFRDLMKKHSRIEWTSKYEKTFELMKKTVEEFVQNHHFDARKKKLNLTHPKEA